LKLHDMKQVVCLLILAISLTAGAQRGDELLVYSVKGKVTALFNNQEPQYVWEGC
jgi:hypothetical protein